MPRTLTTATVALALLSSAYAQSFDGSDVEGFLVVMDGAEPIADRYDGRYDEAMRPFLDEVTGGGLGTMLDTDGEFRIFRLSADAMERAGDVPPVRDYRALVHEAGFEGLQEFGEKADAIMMAYMATQMDAEDMAGMDELTPEMMAMMPPAMREQMAGVLRLQEALASVPAEDLAALRPYRKQLDGAFDD